MLEENVFKDVYLYKASHHGSKHSNDLDTLVVLSPEVAVISCGKYNSYGHPAEEVIKNLQEVGAHIYYTMDVGQISIMVQDKKIKIIEYMKEL